METKQVLANLIDAYAEAKKTGNETLIKLAVTPLQEFIAQHDFVPLQVETTPVLTEDPQSKKSSAK